VLRTDGTLGGFRWGLECKRRLIAHESAPIRRTSEP
jgi:methylated-DNA-[protein]-cysteine S-methyltransferase